MIKLQSGTNDIHLLHYWFTLHAKNHQVLMTSETYETKRGAVIGIKSVIKNMGADGSVHAAYIDTTGKVLTVVNL